MPTPSRVTSVATLWTIPPASRIGTRGQDPWMAYPGPMVSSLETAGAMDHTPAAHGPTLSAVSHPDTTIVRATSFSPAAPGLARILRAFSQPQEEPP